MTTQRIGPGKEATTPLPGALRGADRSNLPGRRPSLTRGSGRRSRVCLLPPAAWPRFLMGHAIPAVGPERGRSPCQRCLHFRSYHVKSGRACAFGRCLCAEFV